MAVLSKIRERSLFLIIIIALALFSFVLSGLFDGNLFNKTATSIGEVNGEPISREEFAQQVEFNRSRSNGRSSNTQNVNNAWNTLVREKVYQTQLEKSGVVVGEKDVWDAMVAQISSQNSPQFANEAGFFDPEKLKEYIATLQDNSEEGESGSAAWLSWINYEKGIKKNLEQTTYNALIRAGLGSTLSEGKRDYYFQNTSVDLDYVYVPFNSIADSLVSVNTEEIKTYIKAHAKAYTVEESRDIQFVQFKIEATEEDEKAIQQELIQMIEDREEYSNAAKANVTVQGFKNAVDMNEFNAENESDTPYDANYYNEVALAINAPDTLFNLDQGTIYGPYKDKGFYKLSKVTGIKQLPDSVKASHILISFAGSATADASITNSPEEAEKVADSLLSVLKADPSKFEELAENLSVDKVSGAKGGDLGWFVYRTMIPEFRDYSFENAVGDMGVVKSQFGYHVIRIEEQKNKQKNVQIATFSRKIDPSETTENNVFELAETFAADLSAGKDINELAKEKGFSVRPVLSLEVFDDNIAELGSQRQIVRWTFEDATEVGGIKRFDLDNGYAVVKLSAKNKAGLSGKGQNVRNIVLNEKKAALIKERSTGSTLDEIATQNNVTKSSSLAVSNTSPVFAGVGRFVDISGVVTSLEENQLAKNIIGKSGVAFATVTKKTLPAELQNYNGNKKNLERTLSGRSLLIFEALKENADIVDNRAVFY
ncbi:peptidylprolyl isomerase [Lutimonas halocynthiae]|uniref:peptidylprolyl isomerase n=1 Tax=Lutimonas halocynthiae TaxID=1446477 RepID=UPI0025B40201|nr:peptidylprolyl isomerase [Lutimonas halocynthiae]MDN3641229.1 peptidylprolyl isomerase [Lutimonas halocynthiae]